MKARKRQFRSPLPTIFLANVRSLCYKMDELNCIRTRQEFMNCCVYLITESWLDDSVPDAAITPPGFAIFRTDRTFQEVDKETGGGLCFSINQQWCADTRILSQTCTPEIETLTIRCCPFYLPREFQSVISIAVYVPPEANTNTAIGQLSTIQTKHENENPGAFTITGDDFNQSNLRSRLPKFYQHVTCPTRGKNILDHLYTTIKGAYRSLQRPPLGDSDHNMVHLVPVYRQQLKLRKPIQKLMPRWTKSSIQSLQGCYACTDWDAFREPGQTIHEYTEIVIDYVNFCQDLCIPEKLVTVYPNDKPWFGEAIRHKLMNRENAYHSGDEDAYRKAIYEFTRAVEVAKRNFREKLEDNLSGSAGVKDVWKNLETAIPYKSKASNPVPDDPKLPDELNVFTADLMMDALCRKYRSAMTHSHL